MKKILYSLLILLLIPFKVNAAGEPNVVNLNAIAEDEGNIILFEGTTENDSHAVMCKLLNGNNEIDKLSVEVNNTGNNGTFNGSFFAPSTGTYTISCANYEGGTIVTTDVTVETITKIIVTFDTGDGDNNNHVQVDAGGVVSKPNPNPTKTGKVFGGWYVDSTYTTPFDFGTRITAAVTIYAKWNDEVEQQNQTRVQIIFEGGGTYQVDFDTDDEDNQGPLHAPINDSANYFVDPNTEVTLTATPSQGHHFVGWYTTHEEEDPNNSEQMIWVDGTLLSEETVYNFTPEGEYVNIKPIFEEDTIEMYTVTFNTNGGSEIAPVEVEAGDLVAKPEDPTNGNQIFVGWFLDMTSTTEFDFNTPITKNTTLYAKWNDPEQNPGEDPGEDIGEETYTVNDGKGNSITFTKEEDHSFEFSMFNYLLLTESELENQNITKEQFDEAMGIVTNAVKEHGALLAFYEIIVTDVTGQYPFDITNANDKFTIKIKYTKAMEKYNKFKLIYIKDDFSIEKPIDLKIVSEGNDKYLVGKLSHLSSYALVGSNTTSDTTSTTTNKTNNTSKSPNTSDNIFIWFIIVAISGLGILIGTISLLKTKKIK